MFPISHTLYPASNKIHNFYVYNNLPAVDITISSSTMLGAGPYTNLVRSYNVPYNVTVELSSVTGTYSVAANTEDWVNFEVLYFFSASGLSG